MSSENCEGCKYFRTEETGNGSTRHIHQLCCAHPEPLDVNLEHWCGEFKPRDEGPKVTKLGQEPEAFEAVAQTSPSNIYVGGPSPFVTPSQRSILKRISDAGKKMHKDCPQIVMAFTRAEVESIGDV